MVDVERGKCGGGCLRVYEVGFLVLFVSLQGLKGKFHGFKTNMCIYVLRICTCMWIYKNIYAHVYTHTPLYICI